MQAALRHLIAIDSLDLFNAVMAIVSSKFIHLPQEYINPDWKIHLARVS